MICNKCHVTLLGRPERCPLCQNPLTGSFLRSSAFPDLPAATRPSRFVLSLSAFLTILAAVTCVVVNGSTTPDKWWSLLVIFGLCSLWVTVGIAFYKRRNLLKLLSWLAVLMMLLALLWDLFTGFHRWSLDFVIPILCTTALVVMTLIAKIQKLNARDYVVYLIIAILLSFSALVLLLCGVLTVRLPALICLATSILFLSALLLFQRKTLFSELSRRLHI